MGKENIIQKLQQIKALTESCIAELYSKEGLKKTPRRKSLGTELAVSMRINFNMNKRAFIKKYGKGMSGPKKFVLILAFLVKGEIRKDKSIREIKKHWNKMTFLLKKKGEKGVFNAYYSTTAKDNNWVDSKKSGLYHLTPSWIGIFSKEKQ